MMKLLKSSHHIKKRLKRPRKRGPLANRPIKNANDPLKNNKRNGKRACLLLSSCFARKVVVVSPTKLACKMECDHQWSWSRRLRRRPRRGRLLPERSFREENNKLINIRQHRNLNRKKMEIKKASLTLVSLKCPIRENFKNKSTKILGQFLPLTIMCLIILSDFQQQFSNFYAQEKLINTQQRTTETTKTTTTTRMTKTTTLTTTTTTTSADWPMRNNDHIDSCMGNKLCFWPLLSAPQQSWFAASGAQKQPGNYDKGAIKEFSFKEEKKPFGGLFNMFLFAEANSDANRLYEDLMMTYNRIVRPVQNNSDRVLVKLSLKLSQLIDVVSSIMVASCTWLLLLCPACSHSQSKNSFLQVKQFYQIIVSIRVVSIRIVSYRINSFQFVSIRSVSACFETVSARKPSK